MSDTNPSNADELIGAIADLLRNYQGAAGTNGTAAISAQPPTIHQAMLPLENSRTEPWHGATGFGPTTNMTPNGELAAKMQWLANNLPGGISMRQLVLDATEKYVNELIAKHYRP